jgi:hypothetical protein
MLTDQIYSEFRHRRQQDFSRCSVRPRITQPASNSPGASVLIGIGKDQQQRKDGIRPMRNSGSVTSAPDHFSTALSLPGTRKSTIAAQAWNYKALGMSNSIFGRRIASQITVLSVTGSSYGPASGTITYGAEVARRYLFVKSMA